MPLNGPILLFNDECGVCRHIANWVRISDQGPWGKPRLIIRPIGEDPQALKMLDPDLNIWDAYATIHLLMPDGTQRLGGEAVAEVFRNLPNTRWFAWIFNLGLFGFKPFQLLLDLAYLLLADVRPIFGCESCGTPKFWVRPFAATMKWISGLFGKSSIPIPHATSIPSIKPSTPETPISDR
jgi:predicted DCC family thiol-disulfide oxidoreductase YuxK